MPEWGGSHANFILCCPLSRRSLILKSVQPSLSTPTFLGLDNMGLFRVSGSVRVVERLRLQFELTGDVDLEGENDVAATAGLLRVFLRDLPDTLVPEKLTPRFFNIVQGRLCLLH